jgi:predicted unusual protein kinase regulating ubiquinone biosynthesis (AarF/ABC1/UbiB family)
MQLFSELDYVREATNGERFRALYGNWENIRVPASCLSLTRKNTLVTEWIDGEKGNLLRPPNGTATAAYSLDFISAKRV